MQLFRVSVVEFAARNTDLHAGTATWTQCTLLEVPCTPDAHCRTCSGTSHVVQSLP